MRVGSGATCRPGAKYVWADGVYLQARMEPQAECILVLIGATPEGKKELVGFQVGMRKSAQSWRELLVDLEARGFAIASELATRDGAFGFGKAMMRCADNPPPAPAPCTDRQCARQAAQSVQPAAKAAFAVDGAGRATAETAITTFAEKYAASTTRRPPAWSRTETRC